MKKNYQILLCEMLYENERYISKPVCEIGSSSSSFPGQAYDIKMKHSIRGTRELTFNVPKYYFDIDLRKQVVNHIPELLVNKSSLEVIVEDKTYFMVVNTRTDEKDGKEQYFSFSCTDAFIEELSKNGYGLSFKESNGVGTIHELAEQIAEGTDWVYDKEKTGDVYETKTELKANTTTQQYEEVTIPVPTHPLEYVPELEQYVYRLDLAKEIEVKNVMNLSGQTIGIDYKNGSNNFMSSTLTPNTGRTVLIFSDNSYIQYYHYNDMVSIPGDITATRQREVERLEYVNSKKEVTTLMSAEIGCKQLNLACYSDVNSVSGTNQYRNLQRKSSLHSHKFLE